MHPISPRHQTPGKYPEIPKIQKALCKGQTYMSDNYNALRQEYNRPSFKDILKDNLGDVCYNCGSQGDIEYHHIVPLRLGGTNKISNIVPLCYSCHKAAHFGRDIAKHRKPAKKTGRPIKHTLDEEKEKVLWDWAKGRIGAKDLKHKLGFSKSMKVKESRLYKDFVQKHGIKNVRNTLDVINANGNLMSGMTVSTIEYNSGDIESCSYSSQEPEWFVKIPEY